MEYALFVLLCVVTPLTLWTMTRPLEEKSAQTLAAVAQRPLVAGIAIWTITYLIVAVAAA